MGDLASALAHRVLTPMQFLELTSLAVGGLAALALVVMLCKRCYRRCRRGGGTYNYERVCHELDREELDFKRALESQCDLEAGGDAQFDDAELEQIEMIEQYRSRLVAGSADDGAEDAKKDGPKAD